MAVYPRAIKKLIKPGSNDPRIEPRVAILHVDAGNNYDLHDYFNGPSGGIESHFHVARDGTVFQYRDTDYQADANHLANDFAVSIETQGYGEGMWTTEQLFAIKELLTWLHETHDIPLRKCPKWDGSGVGYHVQFGAPGKWTPVAKSCPGPKRIQQFENDIVPWMATAGRRIAPTRGKRVDETIKWARRAKRKAKNGSGRWRILVDALDILRNIKPRRRR